MKIYPVLSSDLYVLSCVPVSMLERLDDIQIREHFGRRGSLKFLVAQETTGDVDTATGYMSKHVEYEDLSASLAEDFGLSWLRDCAGHLSDFANKGDLQNGSVVIDSLPTPYIISAFHLTNGFITELSGYALSDALGVVVPLVKYASVSADSAVFGEISSPMIDSIQAKIPAEATTVNQLADKSYVSSLVRANASSFRGTFPRWSAVPPNASGYTEDAYGSFAPNDNDYMVVREVSTLVEDGGTWPAGVPDGEKFGAWRFRYVGEWTLDGIDAKKRWRPEYRIEHYNFTDEQMRAINSKVTYNNRVVRPASISYGGLTRGVYIDGGSGEVREMQYNLNETVPTGAKFTETKVLPGVGVDVVTSAIRNSMSISAVISLKTATPVSVGGIQLGRGLTGNSSSPRVDVATAVKVVEVSETDARSPEQLSSTAFGDTAHVGAVMVVRRGYASAPASYTGYIYTGQAWAAMAGNYSADNVILPRDINFSGSWVGVGNIANSAGGKFMCAGKSVSQAFGMIFGSGS